MGAKCMQQKIDCIACTESEWVTEWTSEWETDEDASKTNIYAILLAAFSTISTFSGTRS